VSQKPHWASQPATKTPLDGQILFLNKIDLFAEKLPRSPLGDYFPDYQGGASYDAACSYLLNRFVSLNQSQATKQIYAHYTCATDTNQIKCALLPQ
jgi:guanine nucleotide-binding protein G(i) subunit alpha